MGDPFFFERRELPGGAHLYHQHRDMPWTFLGAVVCRSSIDELPGEEGAAALLERFLYDRFAAPPPPRHFLHVAMSEWAADGLLFGCKAGNGDVDHAARMLTDLLFLNPVNGDLDEHKATLWAEWRAGRNLRSSLEVLDRSMFGDGHRVFSVEMLPKDEVLDALTPAVLEAFRQRHFILPNIRFVSVGGRLSEDMLRILSGFVSGHVKGKTPSAAAVPLPILPPAVPVIRIPQGDGSPSGTSVIQRRWVVPPALRSVADASLHALRDMLDQRTARTGGPPSCAFTCVHWRNFTVLGCDFSVTSSGVEGALQALDEAFQDGVALRAACDRRRWTQRPDLLFLDMTCEDVAWWAMQMMTIGDRVHSLADLVRQNQSLSSADVLEFIQTHLSPASAHTVVEEE